MAQTILLLGRRPFDMAQLRSRVDLGDLDVHTGTSIDEAKAAMARGDVDLVVMGAGLPLEVRLAVVEHVFTVSESTTVHMKDRASGREGFVPFLRGVLRGLAERVPT